MKKSDAWCNDKLFSDSSSPFRSPTDIVKVLKGVTARRLFMELPRLKKKLWKGS